MRSRQEIDLILRGEVDAALKDFRAASDRLEKALKRHNGWILNGALPEDLAD